MAAVSPEIGGTWWSQQFLTLLESFGLGSRLERGRDYAQSGKVLELDVEPGLVLARVEGSRFTPYRVRIHPRTFSEHQWARAEKAIAARALTLAQLLAGQMPDDIEQVLASVKLALLPASYDELRVTCTCPDGANPCKHTAAVYYMLADRFDADPFALFTLRGRTEDELIAGLRERRARAIGRPAVRAAAPAPAGVDAARAGVDAARAGVDAARAGVDAARSGADAAPAGAEAAPSSAPAGSPSTTSSEGLAAPTDDFWRAGPGLDRLELSPLAAEHPDALLRRLGPFGPSRPFGPFGPSRPSRSDVDGIDLAALLAPVYAKLAAGAEHRGLAS